MPYSGATNLKSRKSFKPMLSVAISCADVTKRFYYYQHRTNSLRELFIRALTRKPVNIRRAEFTLQGFTLDIQRGESVALIGANGSGKSTALRLMAGIYKPTSGTLQVNGRLAAVIELGAGFHPDLTGAENVRLYGAVMGLSHADVDGRFDEIAAFADIGDFMNVPVKYYSSGMQARLAFAVTVCLEPEILLLDEVLAVGDQTFRERCMKRLEQFRQSGRTLVVVSHDLDSISRLCDRAVWLEHGKVRSAGPAAAVRKQYEEAMANA